MPKGWLEVGDRVFAWRYRFYDQQIGAILTDAGPVVIDTRSTFVQARELLDDLRALTADPPAAVVNTHHHYDHAFGNALFRPAPIWGHVRCAAYLRELGRAYVDEVAREDPRLAAELAETTIDPPDRTFEQSETLDLGGPRIELRYLGRGHTDDDIVVAVPDAGVLFAGDLLENGATPVFGDGFPLDWPATLRGLRAIVTGAQTGSGSAGPTPTVVPGHGEAAGLGLVDRSIGEIEAIGELARRVADGELALKDAIAASPYRPRDSREPIERALAQLRGELDG